VRRGRWILISLLGVLGILALGAVSLRLYLSREAEARLAAGDVVNFAARGSAGRINVFATCPDGFCTPAGDLASPVFALPWERLRDAWREIMAAQQNVVLVASERDATRLVYIQRSPFFRFPDIVTVEFVPLGAQRSSIAIDSRSRYGRGDFGVNRRRVTDWMALLEQMIGKAQPAAG
jgi:uncharacterized protein (DUF1499 family)